MKHAVVTGGTSGIGLGIATALAARGARVTLVGRDPAKGAEAAGRIGAAFEAADMSSLASVRDLADRLPPVDVLVNNAGGSFADRQVTAEGHERTLALNLLAPFALTERLRPRLPAGARVVNLATRLPGSAKIDVGDLQSTKRYNGMSAYTAMKVGVLLWTRELARQGVTANAVHPGIVLGTNFGADNGVFFTTIGPVVLRLLRLNTEMDVAVDSPTWLALDDHGHSGGYFWTRRQPGTWPRQTQEPGIDARLWAELARMAQA